MAHVRTLAIAALLFSMFAACHSKPAIPADKQLPFATAQSIEVIAYPNRQMWDKRSDQSSLIRKGVIGISPARIKERATLTKPLQSQLYRALYKKPCKDAIVAACYEPRHAFIFYDAHHKAIAYLEICLDCYNYRATAPYVIEGLCPEKIREITTILRQAGIKYFGETEAR